VRRNFKHFGALAKVVPYRALRTAFLQQIPELSAHGTAAAVGAGRAASRPGVAKGLTL